MYKGHLCIVTNYCDGGDLCELLRGRKAPLPEPQILDLLAQVCSGGQAWDVSKVCRPATPGLACLDWTVVVTACQVIADN